ncbi:MAG: hypothetical protein ABL998_19490 [Planctomycetota bacterium]
MNKSTLLLSGLSLLGLPFFLPAAQGSSAQAPAPASGGAAPVLVHNPYVMLQASTPGQAQNGHINVAGTVMSNKVSATTLNGTAVYGAGTVNGVEGHSTGAGSSGVYGENFVSGGYAVFGRAAEFGVYGEALLSGGSGVLGDGPNTSPGWGVYGDGFQGVTGVGTYGLASFGACYVNGDLTVTGAKTGYVVDLVINDDSVALEPGDLVEIVGAAPALLGEIPLVRVRRASSTNPRAVLGPISNAVSVDGELSVPPHVGRHELDAQRLGANSSRAVLRRAGPIEPGEHGNVVTLGAFQSIKVDASYGAILPGDLLVASPNLGYAMVDNDARTGTVVGKALAAWSAGAGEIPVMVSSR